MGTVEATTSEATLAVGHTITVTIEDIAFGGEGVARHDGLVIFVKFVAPGERVKAEVTEVKKQFARAEVIEVLEPADERVTPQCQYFGQCGGCQYQHLDYTSQLALKQKQVSDLFERIGGFDRARITPIIPSPQTYSYRSRMMVRSQWDKFQQRMKVGLLRHNSRLVVDIEECQIAHPQLNRELQEARNHPPSRGGLKVAMRVMPEGWDVPQDSFFQNNFHLLPELVEAVKGRLRAGGVAHLIDAYCGVGFFSISLSDAVTSYLGVEVDKMAIRAARRNATAKGATNGEFVQGRTEELLPSLLKRVPARSTAVILDPPRTGCSQSILDALRQSQPAQVIYVSCNPSTLARDLQRICRDDEFTLAQVIPLDMFPQTQHVECVADIRLRNIESA